MNSFRFNCMKMVKAYRIYKIDIVANSQMKFIAFRGVSGECKIYILYLKNIKE